MDSTPDTGRRAVVLGGSMAGLLAARVLAEEFDEVVVVDRDTLAGVTGPRRGVPQGRHAHGLVARGQEVLEDLFPGLKDELVADGVVPGDFSADCRWSFNGVALATAPSGMISIPATRPVLERHVRGRVLALGNVVFLEGHDILGLHTRADSDGAEVLGVHVQGRTGGAPATVAADLVVDASGRGSRTPLWLAELGYDRPAEEEVRIDLAYTSARFRVTHDPFGEDIAIIPAATPENPRGGLLYRVPGADDVVELSLTGVLGDHPPTDLPGFVEFARSLPVPDIHDAIADAEPVTAPTRHRYPASVRRHYEELRRFPARYLVVGDAVCSFNPVYAQGMTVAALEALVLRRHVADGAAPDPVAFFGAISREIDPPWSLAAGSDLGYAGVPGRRSPMVRFINAYVARLQLAAAFDARLTNAFIRAAGLVDRPEALLSPRNALLVLRHGWRTPPRATRAAPARAVRLPDAA